MTDAEIAETRSMVEVVIRKIHELMDAGRLSQGQTEIMDREVLRIRMQDMCDVLIHSSLDIDTARFTLDAVERINESIHPLMQHCRANSRANPLDQLQGYLKRRCSVYHNNHHHR